MTSTLGPGASARSRTLFFLSNREKWPLWPFLPVVRRKPEGGQDLGVVFDALGACGLAGYSTTIFLSNYFRLPQSLDQFLALPHETFDVPEEVFAAGWTVD